MQTVTTIGLDIAKSVFQVHGVDAVGQVVIRRQLKRRHVLAFFQKPGLGTPLPASKSLWGGRSTAGPFHYETSDRISFCTRRGEFEPYQNTRLSRYDALSRAPGMDMRRREFVGIVGIAAAWPVMARAQQMTMPVVGFINTQSQAVFAYLVAGFRQGLREAGYVEGRNVEIQYRWAENQIERLPALVTDLVNRKVAVIAATGGSVTALAAKSATTTIPIVFLLGDMDPVQGGIVTSLNRPGANITGVSVLISVPGAKRLELMHELVPNVREFGVLVNPTFPDSASQSQDLQKAAGAFGIQLQVVNASTENEISAGVATLVQRGAGALVISADPFLTSRPDQLVALATRYKLPTIGPLRDFPAAGGLMSYGPNLVDSYRQAGIYVGSILKGASPADLPILQPTKWEFVINLKAAKALDVDIPPKLLVFADEVIE